MKITEILSGLVGPVGATLFASSIAGMVGLRVGQEMATPEPRVVLVGAGAMPRPAAPFDSAHPPDDEARSGRADGLIAELPIRPGPGASIAPSERPTDPRNGSPAQRGPGRTLPAAGIGDEQEPQIDLSAAQTMPPDAIQVGVQTADLGTWSVAVSSWSRPQAELILSDCIVIDNALSIGGPTPNRERCLQSAALGECAFVAGNRSEFRQRAVSLLGNAPGLTALYGPMLDAFGKSLAEERWGYLAGLDQQGNETDTSRPLPDRVSDLSSALTRDIAPDHLSALFGPDDPGSKAREWVENALLDGLYDRSRLYFLNDQTGSIILNGESTATINQVEVSWDAGTSFLFPPSTDSAHVDETAPVGR